MSGKDGRDRPTSWTAQVVWAVSGAALALIVYELLDIRGDEERVARLLAASREGDAAQVRAVLEAGADPGAATARGWTGLHLAAKGGHNEVVEALLAAGAPSAATHPDGWTALHRAAEVGDVALARALLAAGVPIDARGNGRTALGVALALGRLELAGYLIDQGATLGVVDARSGFTPALYAASRGDAPLLSKILDKGGSAQARLSSGQGLLHLAAASGDTEVLAVLLSNGVSAGVADEFGNTPLHIAARRGQVAAARALIEAGADRGARNRAGERPADLARGALPLAELLAPAGD